MQIKALILALVFGLSSLLVAQNLQLPRASQHAKVQQRVGLTEITIDYHRPGVRERAIWGQIVPYGMSPGAPFGSGNPFPWRAGANENTTISFSTDVMVQGKALKAGTYGLHMVAQESGDWTVIFSHENASWGSFFYDDSRDALRVSAKPQSAGHQEWLMYGFDEMTPNSANVYLHWEKMKVSFKVEVDHHEIVLASIRSQLTSLPGFGWQGPLQAANYCLQNNINHDEAIGWADRSINNTRNVNNMGVKARLLAQKGEATAAGRAMEDVFQFAKDSGVEADMNAVGYLFLQSGNTDRAIEVFKYNVKKHPDAWNVYDSLAEGYDQKGERKKAIKNYKTALKMAPANQKGRIEGILSRLESQS